jgi:uncharacterized membrane protein YkvA (DUF1232 family)
MLKALADQLKNLANSDSNGFRETVKKRMNGKVTDEQLSALKEFIFLMPPTLKQLNTYWNDKKTPAEAKRLSSYIISYIYSPQDFISEEKHRLFGYLDDSYLVVASFLKIYDTSMRDWTERKQPEIELSSRARELMIVPRLVIPDVTAKIDTMLEQFMNGEISGFEDALGGKI